MLTNTPKNLLCPNIITDDNLIIYYILILKKYTVNKLITYSSIICEWPLKFTYS